MERGGIVGQIRMGLIWDQVKVPVILPLLRAAVPLCLVMSAMLLIEKIYMTAVILLVKILGRRRPEKSFRGEAFREDLEKGNSAFPMILVQIPMYNEKEVYKLSIGAACGLSWPSDRIIVQVLDDSTDSVIKELVEKECEQWASKGSNIRYERRGDRKGYKAGALGEGMKHGYIKDCEFVAIFDADFQPEPDFLLRAMPFLLRNSQIALVQARWTFVNASECLMTRMQEMSLDYHFTVEQEVGSYMHGFFGFNGTAGVWRISALNEAGGWKDRTTVEDMDLAVRASLKGWKFVYVSDIKVKNELPSTFKAYRYQQHRWSCGPANLFRKMFLEIVKNKRVSLLKKVHVIYNFFFVRKIIAHIVTFVFYSVVIPAAVLVPEVHIPRWGSVYIPSIITILNAIGTPRKLVTGEDEELSYASPNLCKNINLFHSHLQENPISLPGRRKKANTKSTISPEPYDLQGDFAGTICCARRFRRSPMLRRVIFPEPHVAPGDFLGTLCCAGRFC